MGFVPFALMMNMTASTKAFFLSLSMLLSNPSVETVVWFFSDLLYLLSVLIILHREGKSRRNGPATVLNTQTVRQDRRSSEKACNIEKNLVFMPTY